jgi:hypothetical protein
LTPDWTAEAPLPEKEAGSVFGVSLFSFAVFVEARASVSAVFVLLMAYLALADLCAVRFRMLDNIGGIAASRAEVAVLHPVIFPACDLVHLFIVDFLHLAHGWSSFLSDYFFFPAAGTSLYSVL